MKKILYSFGLICLSVILAISSAPICQTITVCAENDYTAKSVVLMDADSGQILFEKDKDKQLPVASMVKLMTILLTLESIDAGNLSLDTKVTISSHAGGMGGSQVFLDAGSEYPIGDLLKSAIVASANDASVALAETLAGSEEEFVKQMNKRAKELNMTNTNYENATGLPKPNAYACASDIAKLMREVLKHDIYFNYSTIWMDELTHPSGRVTELTNTNRLIRYYNGCDAGKTGSTNEAGYCVCASAKKNDLRLISVVVGAKTGAERFSQAGTLLDYGFANYTNEKLLTKGQEIEDVALVSGAKLKEIHPVVEKDCFALTKKSEKGEISIKTELNAVVAPKKAGDVIGKLFVVKNGEVINELNLITPIDLDEYNFISSINDIINNWKI